LFTRPANKPTSQGKKAFTQSFAKKEMNGAFDIAQRTGRREGIRE
jgi:hypothetical protein